jgi:hypothetical protein
LPPSSSCADLEKRFVWGVSVDDPWKFAGLPPPPSIIIPHFLSIRLPRGPMSFDEETRKEVAADEGELSTYQHHEEGNWTALALVEKLKNTGIKMVRIWFPWNFFEPEVVKESPVPKDVDESAYRWPLDDFVNILTKHGLEILPVLGCGYNRMVPKGVDVDKRTAEYIERLGLCSRAVVRRYKDRIHAWQIENEMNWLSEHYAVGWRKGEIWVDHHRLQTFVPDILNALYNAVKSEDSNATVVVNLEGDTKKTDFQVFAKYADLIGIDLYPNYKSPHPINVTSFDLTKEFRKLAGKPIFICETGYPSGPEYYGYNMLNQKEYISEASKKAYEIDAVNGLFMWRFSDSYWRSFPGQENHFGLLDKKGMEKPAWSEYAQLTKELNAKN